MNINVYKSCILCPRNCKVDRSSGHTGYCGQTDEVRAARAALHMWEEPCISGNRGSGAVFFTGCQLRCVFCQNHNIAEGSAGKVITVERLSDIFLELEAKGANNINLVTATHFVPSVIEAIELSRSHGLKLPFVYNTGSYDNIDTIKMLDGLINVYLPDLKYYSSELSARYSNASNYFDKATAVIEEMYRQTGTPEFSEDNSPMNIEPGIMTRGVIVRHLVLPGSTSDSKKVIKYLYETYKDNVFISIMSQYTPMRTLDRDKYQELQRKLTHREYNKVVDYAIGLGVENAFIQEGRTASESFIPEFNFEGL